MNARLLIGCLLGLTLLTAFHPPSQAQVVSSPLTLSVRDDGQVSASIKIDLKPQSFRGLLLLALPLSVAEGRDFVAASDIRVAQINSGRGYTFLAITGPANIPSLNFEIRNALRIAETPDGKGKLEWDVSLPFLTQSEKDLLSLPYCVVVSDITVVLPKRYDDADAYASPPAFVKTDERTFFLSAVQTSTPKITNCRVVFPNPMQLTMSWNKLLVGLLIGSFGVLAQTGWSLREKKAKWIMAILAVAMTMIVVVAWCSLRLVDTRRIEFLTIAAAALPNAIYAAGACLYILIAKKFQAVVGGQVNIDNAPGQWVRVTLNQVSGGNCIPIEETNDLKLGGRYAFYRWRVSSVNHQVIASYGGAEARSNPFVLTRGERKEVPVINISPAAVVAPGTAPGVAVA